MTLKEAENLNWGTYGKGGDQPLKYKTLGECESDHLSNIIINIIDTDRALSASNYIKACKLILEHRKVKLPEELFTI